MRPFRYQFRFAVCAASMLLFAASSVHAQRQAAPIEFHQRGPGIYEVTGGSGANTGFSIGDEVVVVIDAKMDEHSNQVILDKIASLTDKPIAYLINTHSDGDHVNGNPYYPEGVIIISHLNCRNEMLLPGRDGSPSAWMTPERAAFVPELTYQDKLVLHLGSGSIELWHFGVGHTTGDTVVYFPEAKVAFIGDQYFTERPQLIHAYKGGNSFGHVNNLTAMLDAIDAEVLLSGHNEPANRTQITDHIASMQARQETIRMLMAKDMTLEEIQGEFDEAEGALVEVIYNELKE